MADGDAAEQRWLLASHEHCLGWRTIRKLEELNDYSGRRSFLDPVKVEWSSGGSLTISFHSLTTTTISSTNYHNIDVYIENIVAGADPVTVEASLIRVSRTAGGTNYSFTDRSGWPAPDNPIKNCLTTDGCIGKACLHNTMHLTIKLQIFTPRKPGSPPSAPVISGLDSMRKTKTLFDVVLTVNGEYFHAHRAVLAANSVVFAKMFAGSFKEGKVVKIGGKDKDDSTMLGVEIDVKDTTKEAFDIFLQLMYTGEVIDWQGLEVELLVLADRYMVTHVKDACERRLLKMDAGTALGILRHAEKPVISSDVRVRAVQSVLRGWERVVILPQWKDFQEDFPVLADTLRAAQVLMGPQQ